MKRLQIWHLFKQKLCCITCFAITGTYRFFIQVIFTCPPPLEFSTLSERNVPREYTPLENGQIYLVEYRRARIVVQTLLL